MSTIELFSARVCPFAHRTRLVLGEKAIAFQHTEIDLANKPTWFKDVSLYTKVPALRHGELTICESAVINEYLEEVYPSPALFPREPGDRARARILIDHANTRLVQAFGKLLRGATASDQQEGRRELDAAATFIEEALARRSADGPYLLGRAVSLVDCAYYPWFERLPALAQHRAYQLPALPRLGRWMDAVAARPAFAAIANPKEFYLDRYAAYPARSSRQPVAAAAAR